VDIPPVDRAADNWATPWPIVRALEAEFGSFHLDPCCTRETAKAPQFYTAADDGLQRPWWGRVFCNPPYSDIPAWLKKGRESLGPVTLLVYLVPAWTDRSWWHSELAGAEVRFLRGRVPFIHRNGRSAGTPPFGCALLIWRARS
jgi:phage N-6-adenine-methyltransferase